MDPESPVVDVKAIEQVLCQIPEIDAARVVGDTDNLIQELHILASGKKAPRQIVRDIESLLMARFSLPVDHKKISIAQISDSVEVRNNPLHQLRVSGIVMGVTDSETTFEVKLLTETAEHLGKASGPTSKNGLLRLAAMATLDATKKCADSELNFSVEYVSIIPAGNLRVALVCVSIISKAGEETYSGSTLVTANVCDAVVKATLAAVNRHLESCAKAKFGPASKKST